MESLLPIVIAAGLVMTAGAVAFRFRTQYKSSLRVRGDAAQALQASYEVLSEIRETLENKKVTPKEIRAVAGKVPKFLESLRAIEKGLLGERPGKLLSIT